MALSTPSNDPSKPDVVYADIVQRPESASGNIPDNRQEAVIYSELQCKEDTDAHTVAPSGDSYADIEQDPQPASGNGDVYPKNTPEDDQVAVTYSELQRQEDTDTGGHVAVPTGDLNADIEQDPQPASGNGDVYPKNTPEDDQEAVTYSELQRQEDTDTDGHAVVPTGDLNAQISKTLSRL